MIAVIKLIACAILKTAVTNTIPTETDLFEYFLVTKAITEKMSAVTSNINWTEEKNAPPKRPAIEYNGSDL